MKQKINEEKIREQFDIICKKKNIVDVDNRYFNDYLNAYKKIYYAVCFDIMDTINNKTNEGSNQFIRILSNLTIRKVIICFLTGRSSRFAIEYITRLKKKVREINPKIKETNFYRWHCIVDNGCTLYSNDYLASNGFLKASQSLIDKAKLKYYNDEDTKDNIRYKISELLAAKLNIKQSVISEDSRKNSSNRLRFLFDYKKNDKINDELLLEVEKEINDIVAKKLNCKDARFTVYKGIYLASERKQVVIDVIPTNKGIAIEEFSKIIGIPEKRILRIGDQGSAFRNDYEMLATNSGFSVDDISKVANQCYPVIKDGQVLSGIAGVSHILEELKLYPTICLETPKKDVYISKLAKSEKTNIEKTFTTIDYYSHLVRNVFSNDKYSFSNIWNYMDDNTGGFKIYDWEYTLLRSTNPEHILFKIYDIQSNTTKNSERARYKYAFLTDDSILLRGPLNYYTGLCFRKGDKTTITKKLLLRIISSRYSFFRKCYIELRNNQNLDMKNSINRRVLLGIMDSVRDYLLLILNVYIQKNVKNNDVLIIYTKIKSIMLIVK